MVNYTSLITLISGIKQASLGKNDSCLMLELDQVMTVFPLLLSFNFCVSTPLISPQMRDDDQEVVVDQEAVLVGGGGE